MARKPKSHLFYILDLTNILNPQLVYHPYYTRCWAEYQLKRFFNSYYFQVISGKRARRFKIKFRRGKRLAKLCYDYPDSHLVSIQKKKTYRTIQRRKYKATKLGLKTRVNTNYFK